MGSEFTIAPIASMVSKPPGAKAIIRSRNLIPVKDFTKKAAVSEIIKPSVVKMRPLKRHDFRIFIEIFVNLDPISEPRIIKAVVEIR